MSTNHQKWNDKLLRHSPTKKSPKIQFLTDKLHLRDYEYLETGFKKSYLHRSGPVNFRG